MAEVKAHQLAIDTRLTLGLQSTEHVDVYRAVSSLGIACVRRPLESGMSGATLKTARVKLILVNSSKTLGHQNFTIAHEMYHCLYDESLMSKACKTEFPPMQSENEKVADSYAAYLLMPEDGIFHQLRLRGRVDAKLQLGDIVSLEQHFWVSRRAMCRRLEALRLITREECDRQSMNVIQNVRSLGKETALYKPSNDTKLISDYAERAREALDKGLITESRYEEILADAGLLEEIMQETEEADFAD
jgi:Zn-dependent peptidase ImmA (M78 family)